MLSKTCTGCQNDYPLEDFPINRSKSDGHTSQCFPCKREASKTYQAAYIGKDPERRRKQARDWGRRNANANGVRARVYKYGLTDEQIADMIRSQDGVCGLCTREFSNDETFVDHDHTCCPQKKTCGKCVRKILCRACNQGLGLLQDDPAFLRKAADYIESYRK